MNKLSLAFILAGLMIWASVNVHAQSGNVVFLGAVSGTTLALNCPKIPTTPSICIVGDGVWIWQSAASGWTQSGNSGVTQVTINGVTKQGPTPTFQLIGSSTAPTVTAGAPSTTIAAQ